MATTDAKKSKYRFQSEIQQMMFVFGEVADPLQETTMLVEDIIRSQVIEIIIQAVAQAARRNSRYLSAEDLIFLIRHDRAKVNRLRSFLSWKDVRKNTKNASGEQVDDVVDEANEANSGKLRRRIIKLSWELVNQFAVQSLLPNNTDEDSEDEDQKEAYDDSIQRLKDADETTRAMTRDEYVHYSECRQASFTFRKSKRFREWANMSTFMDMKPNDDIVDSLGFLTYEMVSTLTTTALRIRRDFMEANPTFKDDILGTKRKREEDEDTNESGDNDTSGGLFSLPSSEQSPLQPEHIHEAFRRLQQAPQSLKNFRGGLVRTRVSLI